MNAIELLIDDHRKVEKLFRKFDELKNDDEREGEAASVAEKICNNLILHTKIEETLFYPAAKEVLNEDELSLLDEAKKEHDDAKNLISEIKQLFTGEELNNKMSKLKDMIDHHVGEEEGELFPKLEQRNMELDELGEKMEKRKHELMGSFT